MSLFFEFAKNTRRPSGSAAARAAACDLAFAPDDVGREEAGASELPEQPDNRANVPSTPIDPVKRMVSSSQQKGNSVCFYAVTIATARLSPASSA